ncbi:YwdI family protein [Sporosarcina koreensis]|uniref:YwdI family protein n=1 Tax=Sporosarcina koreensis TaxID=334735 RepID=UPI00058F922F|nr:YwdI family protein [Sporosarcina koreensis]
MISVNRVLDELQTQLTKARTSGDEAAIRESVAVMESLCGLILDRERASGRQVEPSSPAAMPAASSMPVSQPLEGRVLEEDDANGGSLFDF